MHRRCPTAATATRGGDEDPDLPSTVVLRAARVRASDTWANGTRQAAGQRGWTPLPHMGAMCGKHAANTTTASGAARGPTIPFFFLFVVPHAKKFFCKKNAENANLNILSKGTSLSLVLGCTANQRYARMVRIFHRPAVRHAVIGLILQCLSCFLTSYYRHRLRGDAKTKRES